MEDGRASKTAAIGAMMRAMHPIMDGAPCVFDDDLAAPLAGIDSDEELKAAVGQYREELCRTAPAKLVDTLMQNSRLSTTVRARYTEDELERAIENGTSQYVILGAGLDSFAYRRRDLSARVNVFEIDFPATQTYKRSRLGELGIDIPSNVKLVPIDFEKQGLMAVLEAAGCRPDAKTFFSWLGVIFYLTDEAIDRTLSQVASMPKGSEIVLDYFVSHELLDEGDREILNTIQAMTARHGEISGHYFTPAELDERFKRLGFSHVEHFGAKETDSRYLANRSDGLASRALYGMVKARV